MKMAPTWKLMLVFSVCAQSVMWAAQAASTAVDKSSLYAHRASKNNGYLPPYSSTNFGDKVHSSSIYTSHSLPPSSSNDAYVDSPDVTIKKSTSHHYRVYSSYDPPASGAASSQYSTSQASKNLQLPSPLPKSVLDIPTSSSQQHFDHYHLQPEYQAVKQPSLLMVEEPSMEILTPSHNRTLQAAKILASTLLEANGEPPLEDTHSQEAGKVNSTDVLIVKAQKKAYIIPTHLSSAATNPSTAQDLYEMREQFEKAYTVNQFIFIIKPEKINFLNKLI